MSGYNTSDSTKLQALAGIANGSIESQSFVRGWGIPAEVLPQIPGGMRAILFVRPLPSTGSENVVTLAIGQSWTKSRRRVALYLRLRSEGQWIST